MTTYSLFLFGFFLSDLLPFLQNLGCSGIIGQAFGEASELANWLINHILLNSFLWCPLYWVCLTASKTA